MTVNAQEKPRHAFRLGDEYIFDDKDENKFNAGIYLEAEARFADRTNYLVSLHSNDPECLKVYRVVGFISDKYVVSDKFGQCRSTPVTDKYNSGAMDLIFTDGKMPEKIFYAADGTLKNYPLSFIPE